MIKQSTLNKHVNLEAVRSYAQHLRTQAERLRDPFEVQPEPSRALDEAAAADLERALGALEEALDCVQAAQARASDRAYTRIYGEHVDGAENGTIRCPECDGNGYTEGVRRGPRCTGCDGDGRVWPARTEAA